MELVETNIVTRQTPWRLQMSKKVIKSLFKNLILFFSTISLILVIIQPSEVIALEVQSSEKVSMLKQKVAKGYANKFCNSIGIGISKEGATRLTINENMESKFNPSLWFELASSGKKNLEKIDPDQLADKISAQIVNDCGYAIGLNGKKGINEFKEYFLTIKDEIDSQSINQ